MMIRHQGIGKVHETIVNFNNKSSITNAKGLRSYSSFYESHMKKGETEKIYLKFTKVK